MTEVKLEGLWLTNFKGIKSLVLDANGENVVVRGDNATGKTTLFDGFMWLLFGKDSQGQANFDIKTLDDKGKVKSGLDHKVAAVLDIDGKLLKLEKVYKEKWTKKRGASKAVLTGHVIDHYVDEVPVKKGEFDERISSFVDEESFRLITNPFAFANLHWQKRRETLLGMAGDVTDEEVISSNKKLSALKSVINERALADHMKIVKGKRAEINKRLAEIPARIDELDKSIPVNITDADEIRDKIWKIEKQIGDIRNGSSLPNLRKKLSEAQAELSELKNKHDEILYSKKRERERELESFNDVFKKNECEFALNDQEIEEGNEKLEKLRSQFLEEAGKEAVFSDKCPTCSQPLPESQVQEAINKFKQDKAEKLEEITAKGKEMKNRLGELKEKNKAILALVSKARKEISIAQDREFSFFSGLEDKIAKADAKVNELAENLSHYTEPDTTSLEQERSAWANELAGINAAQKSLARIEELKKEERTLAGQFEEAEKEISLMESFVVAKVGMVEGKINSMFTMAKFRLFEEQINEGVKECCDIVYQGVPWNSLNRGAQINVGLDIIKTLSAHYKVRAPIFVDNAEAVVNLIDPETQTIKLYVDGTQKILSVSVGEN